MTAMETEIVPYSGEDASDRFNLQRLREIEDAERECAKIEEQWETAKSQTKALKDLFDMKIDNLRRLVRERDDAPLYTQGEADAPPSHEAWRDVSIDQLADHGLLGGVIGTLVAHGIDTLGQLAEWTAGKPLTDIAGIGQAKAEAVDSALMAWFAANPSQRPPVKEADEEEEEGGDDNNE